MPTDDLPLTSPEFEKELADLQRQLREEIESKARMLDGSEKARKKRRKRVLNGDFKFFAFTYFPHHVWGEPSSFQAHFCKMFPKVVFSTEGSRDFWVAPRGECKSTLLTKIGPVFCAVIALLQRSEIQREVGWKGKPPPFVDYITLFGAEAKLPTKLLAVVRTELEVNPALEVDFPEVMGKGPSWKVGELTTRTGLKIEPFGADQAVRGTFHGSSRPKLLLGDDLITDKEARSPTERNNRWDWLEKAIDYLGPPDGTVKFAGVGTILNKDDPISRAKRAVGYIVHHFKALENEPDRKDLWDRCKELMLNDDQRAEETAAKKGRKLAKSEKPSYLFYKKRLKKMNAGAKTSWPSVRSLYDLMFQQCKNQKAFNTEMQGDARSDEDKVFSNLTYWIHLNDRWTHFGACDPSMGKSQTADPSALVIGAWDNFKGRLNVVVANSRRRVPSTLLNNLINFNREYKVQRWAFENNNAYEYMRMSYIEEAQRQHQVLTLVGVTAVAEQAVRIESMEPVINDAIAPKILMHPSLKSLVEQLDEWPEKPNGHHYDLLVALHFCYQIAVTGAGGIPNVLGGANKGRNSLRGYDR